MAPQSIQPSPSYISPVTVPAAKVAEPAPKDQNSMRIEMIALPLIAAVAAFVLLSLKSAIIMTAVITVGAIAYLYRQKTPSPAAKPAAMLDQLPPPSCPVAPPEAVVASEPLYKPKPVAFNLFNPPREKGALGGIIFGSMSDVKAFEKACKQHFQERLEYDYFNDEPYALYFTCSPNLDATQLARELRAFIDAV